MMKVGRGRRSSCSLTFEELVENVGPTSKEHHEIYNKLQLSPENLVPPGVIFFVVVFFSWLFSTWVHL